MMTRPIHYFDSLTSETTPAGGNMFGKMEFSSDERRLLEARARYARAEMMANLLADGLIWLGRQYHRVVAALKADFKRRAAEAQLFRMSDREGVREWNFSLIGMSDRELSDLGLCRADIPFAVREAVGLMPAFDAATGTTVASANENLRRAA